MIVSFDENVQERDCTVTSEDVCRNIRNVKLNNFVFQHAVFCHVCHCSLCVISYYATMAKEKEFLWYSFVRNEHIVMVSKFHGPPSHHLFFIISAMFMSLLLMSSLVFAVTESTQQCRSSYSKRGRYLKGHVISSENVANIGVCYIKCSKDHRCKSINFHFDNLLCELNDADRFTHPCDYVLKKDYAYTSYPSKVCVRDVYIQRLEISASPTMLLSFATCTCSANARNNNCIDKAFGFPTALVHGSTAVNQTV